MKQQVYFNKVTHNPILDPLKAEWRKTLTAPQDGMWEILTNHSNHFEIRVDNSMIGYACVNDDNQLLQFYLDQAWQDAGTEIFEEFINEKLVNAALAGTNNPIFHSLSMQLKKTAVIDTYLFTDEEDTETKAHQGTLKLAWQDDLIRLVTFYHESVGAPPEWLQGYLSNLIARGELFFLFNGADILGTCEVRSSDSNEEVADIGMVVSKNHRQQGIGTFLLGKAKELAYDLNRKPICSCEANNLGSLKCIRNNGFRSVHQMLKVSF